MCHFGVTLGHFGVTLGHFGVILGAKEGTGTNLHVASGGEEGAGRVRGGCEEGARRCKEGARSATCDVRGCFWSTLG